LGLFLAESVEDFGGWGHAFGGELLFEELGVGLVGFGLGAREERRGAEGEGHGVGAREDMGFLTSAGVGSGFAFSYPNQEWASGR